MLLADHNAYLIKIEGPSVPADPGLGIVGEDSPVKWKGRCQAHLEKVIMQSIVNNQIVRLDQTVVQLPANLPVIPATGDMVIFKYLDGQIQKLKVYIENSTDRQFGKITVTCKAS